MKQKSVRCKKCSRLLFKGKNYEVEIKCPKCGYVQILNGSPPKGVDIIHKKF